MQGVDIAQPKIAVTESQRAKAFDYVNTHAYNALGDLYYPDTVSSSLWKEITPQQAAQAVENFLATGNANWRKAMGAQP